MKTAKRKALLTVFGQDRPGIIAAVTKVLFESRCNLEDVSMTILESEFAMMMILSFPSSHASAVARALEQLRSQWKLVIFWKEIHERLHRGEKHPRGSTTYLITALGKDRTGIVYRISQILAGFRLNITDLNSKILGEGPKTLYALMLEVDIPKTFDLKRLRHSLARLSKKLKIEIHLKPIEHIEL